jgi:prepilin-type processing-associated H-X9-DG protein
VPTQTTIAFADGHAEIQTEDPDVIAQLRELDEASEVGEGRFALSAAAARLHFPHLAV